MYGSYEYRRNYAHAIKDVNLAAAQPLKQALANRSLGHMAGSHPRVHGFDSRPDLDPFEMSQSFAYDMVKERMLKHAKVLANEYFTKHMNPGEVVEPLVALKVLHHRHQRATLHVPPTMGSDASGVCLSSDPATPMHTRLPAGIRDGIHAPRHAIPCAGACGCAPHPRARRAYHSLTRCYVQVSGHSRSVGSETHLSPIKAGGLASLPLMFLFERPVPVMWSVVGAVMAGVALQPAVMKLWRGVKRVVESRKDRRANSKKGRSALSPAACWYAS